MPTYTFRNKKTGKTFTDIMSISEREAFLEKNKHIEQLIVGCNFLIGDPISLGRQKPDPAFRSMLKRMKKAHPGSTINTF